MNAHVDAVFRDRIWEPEAPRQDDERDEYHRDRARIIHSAAFRRLQAKTQVMGVGEGDFHRTRLTHSIEVAQIGEGILGRLRVVYAGNNEINEWLPTTELICAACYAHDLGHPPFGHGGECALQEKMVADGGFEGNAQTLRILTRLERYRDHKGTNPTKRLLLAVLKYPVPYSEFVKDGLDDFKKKPPKCYYDFDKEQVDDALGLFGTEDKSRFAELSKKGKPLHRSLDATIMECADDIAYGVHDLEDIVGRRLVDADDFVTRFNEKFEAKEDFGQGVNLDDLKLYLFGAKRSQRKEIIGRLVHLFISSSTVEAAEGFTHPLAKFRCKLPEKPRALLDFLQDFTYSTVIQRPEVQHLERRGKRTVQMVFDALLEEPTKMIPAHAWNALDGLGDDRRRVCDYVAGMTDPYCEKIYQRLFVPGIGSSRDEI